MEVNIDGIHKVTHLFTAQYSIKHLVNYCHLCFYVCKKPQVQIKINELSEEYNNIYVTASKSGKLNSAIFGSFLDNVLKPYVGENNFIFITDSWGGQTDLAVFNEKFINENGERTCQVEIIPPRCTPFCQPCDVYFFRQVKLLISRLQNIPYLLEEGRHVNRREDKVKIHSLVHNQLSAPLFHEMIKYAWSASKLLPERTVFMNVNDVCFPTDLRTKKCNCGNFSFIKYSWCRKILCFVCFYDIYHPNNCVQSCYYSVSESE